MTEADVLMRLRVLCNHAGGQRAFAKQHGFSPAYVNDVLHGRRALADNICEAIGVTRTVTYAVKYAVKRKDRP